MGPVTVEPNGSITQSVYIGKSGEGGQFEIIWNSPAAVLPEPYDALAFPGKTCP